MASHLDGDVPPLWVPDVEGVVVDECRLPGEHEAARARTSDVPHRCNRPSHQNQEESAFDGVGGEELFSNVVLTLTSAAVNDRDVPGFSEAAHPTTEATGHTHQMGVVQLLVGAIHQAPPPGPKPAGRVAQAVVGVQDDAIDTVVRTLQQISIPLGQLVGHSTRVN